MNRTTEPFQLCEDSPQEQDVALQRFFSAARRSRVLANCAMTKLIEVTPLLVDAIASGSGQGQRIEAVLWSCWNGTHKVGLCDALCGLDTDLGEAVLTLLAARTHMGGDADPILKKIIHLSGSTCPSAITQPQ